MKISGIDFPKPLLNALWNNQLVLFAGAGVSIPPPAGLPTFRQLAEAVALGSGETIGQDEPEDHFLGRLDHKGQQVHLQAAQELQKNASRPTDLHRDLLNLHPSSNSLRVVTTNFDTLFEEAAKEHWVDQPEVFRAPALPLGAEFNGIVHIHGSIDNPPNMVLTDADFGRAYLTEGWARRFLVDLFRAFTVLFVGYGHNDTVMNYLARALPIDQTQSRFVITDEADGDRWEILGTKPVFFAKPDKYDYSALYKGIAGLAKYARRGILDWQRDITEIAKTPPSLDQEVMDLVGDGLSDPARTRFFTEAASHIDWVQWLDERGHLDSLFGVGLPPILEETERTLGLWLARTFANDHPDEMFRLIAKHGMNLHQEFWYTLGDAVASPKDIPWDPATLARWVSLLLATAPPQTDSYILLRLGERCIEVSLTRNFLDIFRLMSATKLSIKDKIAFEENPRPSTTAEVVHKHEHHELNQMWETGIKPNLDDVAELLLKQLVDSFTTRHRTLCSWQAARTYWDIDSYVRSAIEPHPQDAYPQPIDVLIDAARDTLEHLVSIQPKAAADWCDQLIRSEAPMLRRLAVHALASRSDLTSNAKIDWILDRIDIHDHAAHHELFGVMQAIYPNATEEQRQAIIEEVHKFTFPGEEGEEKAKDIAYQKFNWFSWLRKSDPNCSLVNQQVEDILKQHSEFKPRGWADLNHYSTGGVVGHRSPWSAEELLSSPAKEWTEKLLAFRDPDRWGEESEDRVGLVRALEEAVTKNFEWGLELADDVVRLESWENDLWRPLMNSWARQEGVDQWGKVLQRLLQSELHGSHARTIAETLAALVKDQKISYSSGLLSQANQVATTLWDSLDENEPVSPMEDWYGRAINHSAGILAEFWMHSISSWYNQLDPRPAKISEDYLGFLHKICEDETTAGRLGKSAIARHFSFLTAVDQEWAVENLVPLFDNENKEDRRAFWEGFLHGLVSPPMAEILEGPFSRALSDMDELFPQETKPRERFISHFTTLVTYFVDDPLDSWIPKFFDKAGVDERKKFAQNIADILRQMEIGRQRDLWDRWLRKYWVNRLHGTPAKLDPTEVGAMLGWLPYLHDLFPEAVELTTKATDLHSEHGSIIYSLNRMGTGESYPEATAKLLVYLAGQGLPPWAWRDAKELIENLINHDLSEDLGHQLKEILVKLGL